MIYILNYFQNMFAMITWIFNKKHIQFSTHGQSDVEIFPIDLTDIQWYSLVRIIHGNFSHVVILYHFDILLLNMNPKGNICVNAYLKKNLTFSLSCELYPRYVKVLLNTICIDHGEFLFHYSNFSYFMAYRSLFFVNNCLNI